MKSFPPPSLLASFALVVGIVVLAGLVDACSFVRFQELFVSFMSGNTTSLGVAVARHELPHARQLAVVIGLFVAGVVLGTLLHHRLGNRWSAPVLLALVALLLLLAHAHPPLGIGGLTLAMGVLNASVHKIGDLQVSLTYFTGALVKFGTGLADLLSGRNESWNWLWQLGLWLGFLGGAVVGAVLMLRHESVALPLATGFSGALALLALGARGLR